MRHTTLAYACRRAQTGERFDEALGEFLQSYYLAPDVAARVPMLTDDQPLRSATMPSVEPLR